MTLKSSFANVLRAMRGMRNITQREFADTTSRTYLSKLEAGRSSITLHKLEQLSERLNLSPLAILTLTLSEHTGQSANELIATLRDEIRDLEQDGCIPGLRATLGDEPMIGRTARALPRSSATTSKAAQAGAPQTELSFTD
ncbi:helix-turn-helix domain-containing protein [Pseudomonas sp. IsoF]|uniref:helix-turn-helix domain-containing protein n=1 Tax=Pseudomonas sp. IsoF TaxID=2821559 RepID=UPI0021C37C8A|nr:helix-turn-helix transcriptional regulator [Pseudomonas sp. IsoF]